MNCKDMYDLYKTDYNHSCHSYGKRTIDDL